MSVVNKGHRITSTDNDGDTVSFTRLGRGGVSVQLSVTSRPVYIENEDIHEMVEFLKFSHKVEVECDTCKGKGKVAK